MTSSDPKVEPSRTEPDKATDPEERRRGVVTEQPQTSSLPEAERVGEPGEEVLGGADGVPLGHDHPPKDEAAKKTH